MLKIGSHVSFKAPNYLVDSMNESIANGANAMMIYLGPPQNTKRVSVDQYKLNECIDQGLFNKIERDNIIVHAPYIINPSNIKKSDFAKQFLIDEIERMNYLSIKYLVLHPGASLDQDLDFTLVHLANVLKEIISKTKDVVICIETMAGKGTEVGINLEQIKKVIDIVNDERIAICLDTCHMWDSGYDVKTDFEHNNGIYLINKLKELSLLNKVKVIHLNDSKNDLSSHKDRHENIGRGFIGLKALKNFANHKVFDNIPIILETPYVNDKSPYKDEIRLIKGEK